MQLFSISQSLPKITTPRSRERPCLFFHGVNPLQENVSCFYSQAFFSIGIYIVGAGINRTSQITESHSATGVLTIILMTVECVMRIPVLHPQGPEDEPKFGSLIHLVS